MSNIPADLRFAESHEWARLEADGTVTVGISDHAQQALGDVVFVELAEVGKVFAAGDAAGVVESVKAASDIYAPVGGEVIAVNEELADSPEQLNEAPYAAWIFKLKPSNPAELDKLLDAAGYQAAIGDEAGTGKASFPAVSAILPRLISLHETWSRKRASSCPSRHPCINCKSSTRSCVATWGPMPRSSRPCSAPWASTAAAN